jgi:hypothetical protein
MNSRHVRGLALVIGSFLASAGLNAAPCPASPTVLCLAGQRFAVEVRWKDFQGNTGQGQGVQLTPDTGYFWFFSDNNIELVVKVLDARGFNNHFWVFFGALSNVEYTLKVTDTGTGAVKEYQNPSGQFASVGDTAAFPGATAGVARTHETVTADGAPAREGAAADLRRLLDRKIASAQADFTPCKSLQNILRLSGCRFSIRVTWRDPQGQQGQGTAVQLTNDTGYFWFFTDNNVELIIKVLDARALNGSYWVFYGALSNVQYTLTVTDTLTGVTKSYTNPSGAFASVGDTSAFKAGRSVTGIADSGLTASADIDAAGGTLSATAANGTQFILEVPPNAFLTKTTVKMTPLSRVDGLPLKRGLIGGVQLEPEGVRLFVPATLRIRPSGGVPKGGIAFSYAGKGDEFALDLSKPGSGEVLLQLLHFSGFGFGGAAAGDVTTQQGFTPADPIAAIRQQAQAIIERGRQQLDENGDPLKDESGKEIPAELTPEQVYEALVQLVIDAFNDVINPLLQSVLPDCNPDKILFAAEVAINSMRGVQFLGLADDKRVAIYTEGTTALIIQILQQCLEKVHRDCVINKDPFQAWTMVLISRQLQLFGAAVPSPLEAGGPIESCLRFEFQFDSTIAVNLPGNDVILNEALKAHARAPLRIDPSHSTTDVSWSGSGTTSLTSSSVTYTRVGAGECRTTSLTTTDEVLKVGDPIPALLMPLSLTATISADPALFTSFGIRFGWDPGKPKITYTVQCPRKPGEKTDPPPLTVPSADDWGATFESGHALAGEYKGAGQGLLAEGWDLYNIGGLYAQKTYQISLFGLSNENTTLVIKHTPDE